MKNPKLNIVKSRTAGPIFLSAIILALFAITFISGCNKDPLKEKPVACFAAIADSVTVNTTLTVNASCSQEAVSYAWDFGDGSTAATISATHSYATPGSYIITLTVTNSNGTATKTETVVVKDCNFGYEGTNCATEVRARYLGLYLVGGNINCSASSPGTISSLPVTVSTLPTVTQLNFTISSGGTPTTLTGDLQSNGTTFTFSSQQDGGYTYTGTANFDSNFLALELTETNNSTSEVCTITVAGIKQ